MARKFDHACDQLRHLGGWLNNWNETWNQQWTVEQLIKLHTFHTSPQSDHIDEMIDRWPRWLTAGVLMLPLGGQLDAATFKRAKALDL